MYKDKDKQREAVKKATQRYRANKGDSALSDSKGGLENARGSSVVDEVSDTQPVIPQNVIPKDIKRFADLPPDVQVTINKMSTIDGKTDEVDKAKRTARAIHYQSLFPSRYYSTGVAL